MMNFELRGHFIFAQEIFLKIQDSFFNNPTCSKTAMKFGKAEFHLVPQIFFGKKLDAVERVLTGPGWGFAAMCSLWLNLFGLLIFEGSLGQFGKGDFTCQLL